MPGFDAAVSCHEFKLKYCKEKTVQQRSVKNKELI